MSKDSFFWCYKKRAKLNNPNKVLMLSNIWLTWFDSSDELPKELHKAYISYNTTLPSSASIERLFSLGYRIMNPLHTKMLDSAFVNNVLPAANSRQ